MNGEDERRRERLKQGTLKRMRLTSWQHLQQLVLIQSQLHLQQMVLHTEGADQHRHFHVLYLDLLVDQSLDHGSFEANVAMNGFLYGCSAVEVVRFQDFLTQRTSSRLEGQVTKRRKVILDRLKEQLGPLVRTESGRPSGQMRLFVDPTVDPEPIVEILAALVPWDGRCDLPAGIGDRPSPEGPWPHVPDLHSTAPPSSPEEEPQYEVNRLYAVIAPTVRQVAARMLTIEDNLHMPRLFPVKTAPSQDPQP